MGKIWHWRSLRANSPGELRCSGPLPHNSTPKTPGELARGLPSACNFQIVLVNTSWSWIGWGGGGVKPIRNGYIFWTNSWIAFRIHSEPSSRSNGTSTVIRMMNHFYFLSVIKKVVLIISLRIIRFLQQGAYWHDLHIKVRRSENKDCIQINNLISTVNYQKKTKTINCMINVWQTLPWEGGERNKLEIESPSVGFQVCFKTSYRTSLSFFAFTFEQDNFYALIACE